MKDKIYEIIDKMEGSLLGIGIDDKGILEKIETNSKINLCYILSNDKKGNSKKFRLFKKGKNKKVNIKKLKNYFKIKSIDNILCDYDVVKKHIRSFQGGSVYINKGKLYIYGKTNDLKELDKKYKRYTDDIKLIKKDNWFILSVNNEKTKSTIIKDGKYMICDFFTDTLDKLTDLLTN